MGTNLRYLVFGYTQKIWIGFGVHSTTSSWIEICENKLKEIDGRFCHLESKSKVRTLLCPLLCPIEGSLFFLYTIGLGEPKPEPEPELGTFTFLHEAS